VTLDEILGDSAMISRMDDAQFDSYWTALGTAIRIACQAQRKPQPPPAQPETRTEINCTNATTERTRAPHADAPASPFGLTMV
jgi:hypothetical protein